MKRIWTYVVGALCIAGGVLLILNPQQSLSNLIYYLGIALVVTGGLKIVSSIINKAYFVPGSSFMSGVWNVIFGLLLMTNANSTIKIIPIFIGLWLIITAVSGLIVCFNFRKTYLNTQMLVSSILKLVLGIVVLTTPIISIVFSGAILGIILIFLGIVTIVSYKETDDIYKVKVK